MTGNRTPKQIAELHDAAFCFSGMNDSGARVVPVDDDAMEPTLRKGDCVLVDPSVDQYVGEGLYVLGNGAFPRTYRVQPNTGGGLCIISDNKLYAKFTFSHAEFNECVLGKVLALGVVLDHRRMEAVSRGGHLPA